MTEPNMRDDLAPAQAPGLPAILADDPVSVLQRFLHRAGITDDDHQHIIIKGELTLTERRARGFVDWLEIGHAVEIIQEEVARQTNSTNPRGRRYSDAFARIAPDRLRLLSPTDRSHAIWLWQNRDQVQEWYRGRSQNERDKWTHPYTIRHHYKRTTGDGRREFEPATPDRRRRSAQAAIDEATQDLRGVVDNVMAVSGGASALIFDLSTSELAFESARNFVDIYQPQFNRQGLEWFIAALGALLNPPQPEVPPDQAFVVSLRQPVRRRRRRIQRPIE
jgi:hypothetical protein